MVLHPKNQFVDVTSLSLALSIRSASTCNQSFCDLVIGEFDSIDLENEFNQTLFAELEVGGIMV
jgi:hypothetical protein